MILRVHLKNRDFNTFLAISFFKFNEILIFLNNLNLGKMSFLMVNKTFNFNHLLTNYKILTSTVSTLKNTFSKFQKNLFFVWV